MKRLLCFLFGHAPLYSEPHFFIGRYAIGTWWYECRRCGDWALSSDRLLIRL